MQKATATFVPHAIYYIKRSLFAYTCNNSCMANPI